MHLLDTNTCVEDLRRKSQLVIQRIQSRRPDELSLCSVVVAERYYGAIKSPYKAANLALLATFLPTFTSLPFDDAAARNRRKSACTSKQRGFRSAPMTFKSPQSR